MKLTVLSSAVIGSGCSACSQLNWLQLARIELGGCKNDKLLVYITQNYTRAAKRGMLAWDDLVHEQACSGSDSTSAWSNSPMALLVMYDLGRNEQQSGVNM